MKNAEAVLMIKFRSYHCIEELITICSEDLERFRSFPGLVQKFYLSERRTGAISWFYIFEDQSAMKAFWNSKLVRLIPSRYGVIAETLRAEQYDMAIVLNDELVQWRQDGVRELNAR